MLKLIVLGMRFAVVNLVTRRTATSRSKCGTQWKTVNIKNWQLHTVSNIYTITTPEGTQRTRNHFFWIYFWEYLMVPNKFIIRKYNKLCDNLDKEIFKKFNIYKMIGSQILPRLHRWGGRGYQSACYRKDQNSYVHSGYSSNNV